MGSVYAAEHPILKRKVAIKMLRRELAEDRSLVQRFINEARVAAAIRHRNIIEINDVGVAPSGIPYILMEFLEGETLGERIKREGKLCPPDAIEFACQAADALAAAHAKGVIHRDLKPENLFIVPDPIATGRELIKVLDFGIAKLRDGWSGGEAVKTGTGSLIGTPPYMAPEQCRGLHEEIDARSDIYALGTIIFEMLCGQPPFTAKGWGEILLKHMTEPPPLPSSLNPALPPHLDEVILRMLAKDKADRYSDMREVRLALDAGRTISGFAPAGGGGQKIGVGQRAEAELAHPKTTVGAPAEGGMTTLSGASGVMDEGDVGEVAVSTASIGGGKKRVVLVGGMVAAASIGVLVLLSMRTSPSGGANSESVPARVAAPRALAQPASLVEPAAPPPAPIATSRPAEQVRASPVPAAVPELPSAEIRRMNKKARLGKDSSLVAPPPAGGVPPIGAPPPAAPEPTPALSPPSATEPATQPVQPGQKKKNDKLW